MVRGKQNVILAILVLWVAGSGGCVPQALMVEEAPWHLQPSGVYDTFDGKRFYGVGRASGIRNRTLLKATAGNAARKEMEGVLHRYVAALTAEAASQMQDLALSPGELVQLKGLLVRNAVQRAVISDHWSPGQRELMALCELDLEMLKHLLTDDALPRADIRRVMWTKADQVHARLSRPFHSDQQ